MRRILFVHHCADLGGASLSMLGLIEHLDPRRYEPHVLFNCAPGQVIEPFAERRVRILEDPSLSTYPHAQGAWLPLRSLRPWEGLTRALQIGPSARRFQRFLETNRYDLVHLNSLVQVPAALGARRAGVPVIWHIREELHPGYLGLRRALIRRCVECCASAVVAISERNRSQLIRSDKATVVYNPVDFARFDRRLTGAAFRHELGIPDGRPIVGMLGGVVAHKGADVFVEAAALVRARRPEALFVVAGMPPVGAESSSPLKRVVRRALEECGILKNVERRVRRSMRRHDLESTVKFVGMRRDIPEMLAACTLLVWPATVSHASRPVLEAGAMARPVVASDFPSSREEVIPERTGLLVRPGRASDLADAIMRLLEHPDEARRMGEQGYQHVRERYDSVRSAGMIASIYDGIMSGGRMGSGGP